MVAKNVVQTIPLTLKLGYQRTNWTTRSGQSTGAAYE